MAHPDFITVTHGCSGYFAVHLTWAAMPDADDEEGGFYEPWQTGHGRYRTREQAALEAIDWAESEEMEYRA